MIRIEPNRIEGSLRAPPSKSVTHRAYLLAAQAGRPAVVAGPLRATDTDATLAGLQRLGFRPTLEQDAVRFDPAPLMAPSQAIDCRNSGTSLRFLAAAAARLAVPVHFTGDASLSRRTSVPLWKALRSLGVTVESHGGGLPVSLRGPLRAGQATLEAHVSSQFASGLLFSLPFLDTPSRVHLAAPIDSSPYLELSLAMAREQGLLVREEQTSRGRTWDIAPGRPKGGRIAVEGDWSSAAFLIAAGHLTGGSVQVEGLDAKSLQPDRSIVRLLAAASEGTERTFDVHACPDLFPILAVVAAFAPGTTTFEGGTQLRNKETDRIAAMAEGLGRMGIRCDQRPDGLVVRGGKPRGADLRSHGDHRIHMALCIAALAAQGASRIDDEDTAAVSFPGFHETLARLGARIFKADGRLEAS